MNRIVKSCHFCGGSGDKLKYIPCVALERGDMFCEDHMTHLYVARVCVWCLGSGKADIFTKLWRKLRSSQLLY